MTIATLPSSAVRPGKVRMVVEQKYKCGSCAHEFSTIEESTAE